jgi:hypothetical protein
MGLFTCCLSEMINSRVLSTVILQFWTLPLLVVLYTFTEHTSQWVYFAVVSLIVGFPFVHYPGCLDIAQLEQRQYEDDLGLHV